MLFLPTYILPNRLGSSTPLKVLLSLSCQIVHNTHNGVAFQSLGFLWWWNLSFQQSSIYCIIFAITQNTFQLSKPNDQMCCATEQWSKRCSTNSPLFLHAQYQLIITILCLWRLSIIWILLITSVQVSKQPF